MTAQTRSRAGRRLVWLAVVGLPHRLGRTWCVLARGGAVDRRSRSATQPERKPCTVVNSPDRLQQRRDVGWPRRSPPDPCEFDGVNRRMGRHHAVSSPARSQPLPASRYAGLNWTTAEQAVYGQHTCSLRRRRPTNTPYADADPPTSTPTDAPTGTPTGSVAPTQTVNPTDPTQVPSRRRRRLPRERCPRRHHRGSGNGPINDGWRIVLLALAGILAAALLLTPATAVVRKDDADR